MKPSYFSIFFTNECYFLAWSEHTLNLQNKNRGTKFDLVFSRLHLFLQTLSASSSSSSPSYFCFPWMGNEQQQKWNKSMKDSVGGGERNLTRVRSTCRWPQNTTSPEISRIFAIVYRSQLKFQCFIFFQNSCSIRPPAYTQSLNDPQVTDSTDSETWVKWTSSKKTNYHDHLKLHRNPPLLVSVFL